MEVWTKVEVQLPDVDTPVLAFDGDQCFRAVYDGEIWWDIEADVEVGTEWDKAPTHWVYLPDWPEDDVNDSDAT